MAEQERTRLFRFGVFEADEASGELRKQGVKIKIHAQAFQVLVMLLENPGEVVSRKTIQQQLWPDGTFVDFDHGVNSAVNRIRESLGDSAANPRYVETLARRGYRFLPSVNTVESPSREDQEEPAAPQEPQTASTAVSDIGRTLLAASDELPQASHRLVRNLFLLLQLMYLGFYIGALANLPEIAELLSDFLLHSQAVMVVIIATAAMLIPVRLFLIAAVAFRPPAFMAKFVKLFPVLLLLDELWALSPFLLLHHINFGLALAATAMLVYSPFAQRSLALMMERPLVARQS